MILSTLIFDKSFNTLKQFVCIESIIKNPKTSIQHHGQELDISRSSLQDILTKDLHYKVQLTQELKLANHAQRVEFLEWIMK